MPHMAASPFRTNGLEDGYEDGQRDAARIAQCPPQEALGMDPVKSWSYRYQRGYGEAFDGAQRHVCTPECA